MSDGRLASHSCTVIGIPSDLILAAAETCKRTQEQGFAGTRRCAWLFRDAGRMGFQGARAFVGQGQGAVPGDAATAITQSPSPGDAATAIT